MTSRVRDEEHVIPAEPPIIGHHIDGHVEPSHPTPVTHGENRTVEEAYELPVLNDPRPPVSLLNHILHSPSFLVGYLWQFSANIS